MHNQPKTVKLIKVMCILKALEIAFKSDASQIVVTPVITCVKYFSIYAITRDTGFCRKTRCGDIWLLGRLSNLGQANYGHFSAVF
jgi:hypothetical protein